MFNFKLKTTTAIYCPFCKSPLVEHEKSKVNEDEIHHDEKYKVECDTCGANGVIVESWIIPKKGN